MTSVDWRAAVELATLAPSVHNTQPWRFVADRHTVEVWADRTRAVQSLDPTGRQLDLSCGAAIEQLCLALAADGWRPDLELVPDSRNPDLLARIRADVALAVSTADAELANAIPHRVTMRSPFESRPIPYDEVESLRLAVEDAGAWLRPITRPEDVTAMAVLLEHADAAERTDSTYLAEISRWRRHEKSPDGVPDAAISPVEGRHTNFTLRDFAAGSSTDEQASTPPVDEHPLVVVVGTPNDTAEDWIVAGRGVARLLLRATALGISASPLNQVIDDPAPRQQFRVRLGLVGYPQMVLRMGYGVAVPATGRRPVDEVLTVSDGH